MKTFDSLILLVAAVSIILFIRASVENKGGPSDLKVYEGEKIPNGRNGTAELKFINIFDDEIQCNISVKVSQWWTTRYEDSMYLIFPPGESLTNLSIFLPDGNNRVIVNAKC